MKKKPETAKQFVNRLTKWARFHTRLAKRHDELARREKMRASVDRNTVKQCEAGLKRHFARVAKNKG